MGSALVVAGYSLHWRWTGFQGNTLYDWLHLLVRWGLFRRLRAHEPEDAGPELLRAAGAALGRDQAAAAALERCCAGLARAAQQIGEGRVSRPEFAHMASAMSRKSSSEQPHVRATNSGSVNV